MAKNEEGEFELILGNRQLISVFLIVVILLGVFFSMGYIVGRNSASGSTSETAHNTPDARTPAPEQTSSTPPPAPEPPPVAATPESTHPVQAPAPPAPEPKPAPKTIAKMEKPSPAPAPPVTAAPGGEPGPGTYWQVVATSRPDAEIITEALVKKGFHAVLAPAPREGVFRVLVGPLSDAATQSQTRTQLEAAGFKNPMARKY